MQNRNLPTTAAVVLVAVGVLYGIGYGSVHAKPAMPAPLAAETKAAAVPKTPFVDAKGGKHSIADFKGHYVLVNLWVDTSGNPSHVKVIRGVGMGLDEKALEAVRQYKFKPAMENGKPVLVELNVEVNFQIF